MLSTDVIFVTILTWSLSEATTIYKEVLINATTNISCIPNQDIRIQWHHTAPSGAKNYFYAEGRVYLSSDKGFRLEEDLNSGPYYLVIPHARDEDAGLYECKEATDSPVLSSTQLTVLESSLVCKSDMRPDGYVGPSTCNLKQDHMTFSCAVSFSGEAPHLTWKILNDSQSFNPSKCKIETGRINCSLTIRAESKYDGSTFSCQTAQSTAECSTEIIKVQYFERQLIDRKPPLVVKKIRDRVNCSVKSNQKLEFEWIILSEQSDEYETVTNKQELVIRGPGFYRCEVKYSIRNAECNTPVQVSEVNVRNPCEPSKEVTTVTAGTSAISVLSMFAVISIVVIVVLE